MSDRPAATSLPHPSPEELVALAESRLDAADAEQLAAHLDACTTCREMVDDLRAFDDLEPPGDAWRVGEDELESTLASLRRRLPTPSSPSEVAAVGAQSEGGGWRWLPWAAVMLLSVGLVLVYVTPRDQQGTSEMVPTRTLTSISERSSMDCFPTDQAVYLELSLTRALELGPHVARFRRGDVTALELETDLDEPARSLTIRIEAGELEPDDYDIVLRDVNREQDIETTFPVCFRDPKEP